MESKISALKIKKVQPHNFSLLKGSLDYIVKYTKPFIDKIEEKKFLFNTNIPYKKRLENITEETENFNNSEFQKAYKFITNNPVKILILPNNTYLSLDGDHRMYIFDKLGQKTYPFCQIYDLNNQDDRIDYLKYKREKLINHLLKEGRPIDSIKKYVPEVKESDLDLDKLYQTVDFLQENGIFKYSDLQGKISEDEESRRLEYETAITEYLQS